ncbi:MAG: glucose-6-phosphate dehydrogenase [Myxococcota bacterium]|nr:glucose-6-phosphate dehydrogenase [Myxococcota bacterium]
MSSPCQIVIFGASGDLTRRKLIPALASLAAQGKPAAGFSVVGVARREKSDEQFRSELRQALPEGLEAGFDELAPRISYLSGSISEQSDLQALAERLDGLPGGRDTGRLFYLSLKPDLFGVAVSHLSRVGLLSQREGERRAWRRVVIEKPFGHDLASARALNAELHEYLREDQIYRIDHYLGKETVQNLLGFRFHNAIFEPLWNRHHVECVQVSVAESIGVEAGRGGYYDGTGALRDMLQNHMLQILALITMEPPASLDADAVRSEKVEVLRALHWPDARDVRESSVRAQYAAGLVDDKPAVGYREEEGVSPESQTETYVAVRAEIDNWRWGGVPFLLRHGKRMPHKFTEVKIHFRTAPVQLFNRPEGMSESEFRRQLRDGTLCQLRPNVLTLSIQPREAMSLSFGVKQPGNEMMMAPATLAFDYRDHFQSKSAEAYERLQLDAMQGDQTLFLRADEIEACWTYADQVLDGWRHPDGPPMLEYPAGTWGPPESDTLFHGCEGTWSRGDVPA